MTEHSLADAAATLRSTTLTLLRSPLSRECWSFVYERGHRFTMPAKWAALPRHQQIEQLLKAEDRRIASGTTFALDSAAAQAVSAVAHNLDLPLPFSAEILPAPSGMIVAADPLVDLASGTMVAISWGPPMDGFGAGVHLTWWGHANAQDFPGAPTGREVILMPDFDMHLPFAPLVDARLWHREVSSGALYSQVPLRAVVAAWYALTTPGIETVEHRPAAVHGRALAAQKAKSRGVRIATAATTGAAEAAIVARAADFAAQLLTPSPDADSLTGFNEATPTPHTAPHGVFAPEHDHQLDAEGRRTAFLYRTGAEHWHRLEQEAAQTYPGIFAQLEELRALEHGQWRSWCWVPGERVSAWLVQAHGATVRRAVWDGPRIAALGAWRSGGRHALLANPTAEPHGPSTPVPAGLLAAMPACGLGLILPAGQRIRLALTCLDDGLAGRQDPDDYAAASSGQLVVVSDEGERARGLRELTKYSIFLTGQTLQGAVKATQQYFDRAAVRNGQAPQPADDAGCAEHAVEIGSFTGPLTAICASGAVPADVGALTGRKEPAPWPPEPSLLAEVQLWRLAGTSAA
ncbi:hypothetical protein [Streptacidiphilus sp. EB103A]|uniref:hypothetical protein n=1 Tax=Streptacidiphilus sp. EB103A TaxID=3156275 RepID=UPI0035174088